MIPAIIPARGGSKRIKNKNIRSFAGKPIICHAIRTAWASGRFDRVIVSTDSERVAETARGCGAEVPFMRPEELSDDHAVLADVVLHALRFMLESGEEIAEACLIYATAPMLRVKDLCDGLKMLREHGADAVISVAEHPSPVQRALKVSDDGYLSMLWPEYQTTRSQDLSKAYHDAGQFHWLRVEPFLETGVLYMKKCRPLILPQYLGLDIDTAEDLALAKKLYRALFQNDSAVWGDE